MRFLKKDFTKPAMLICFTQTVERERPTVKIRDHESVDFISSPPFSLRIAINYVNGIRKNRISKLNNFQELEIRYSSRNSPICFTFGKRTSWGEVIKIYAIFYSNMKNA